MAASRTGIVNGELVVERVTTETGEPFDHVEGRH